MFGQFSSNSFTTHGVIGSLAPTESLRFAAGYLDKAISPVFPPGLRYILFGACTK